MNKNTISKLSAVFLFLVVASLLTSPLWVKAWNYKVVPTLLTTFSNGSSTFDVSFPPGGGTNSDAKITLPKGTTIFSASVDMVAKGGKEVGTPYIWVPLSATNGLVQIKTSDGSFVSKFNNSDIWDCTANCDTNNPTWTARGVSSPTPCSFNNPSRITVIPGGDVWVANRGGTKVTRLGLVDPSVSTWKYECKDAYDVGSGPRGVTFDLNGNIWVGDYGDHHIWKFNSDGTYAWSSPHYVDIGHPTYGMIADSKGNVWISTGGDKKVVMVNASNCDTASCPVTVASGITLNGAGMLYGIGIDNDEDIWIGNWKGNSVDEIDNSSATQKSDCTSGFSGCCTGTAVDKSNNVWTSGHDSNNIFVIKGGNCGEIFSLPAGEKVCDSTSYSYDNGRIRPHGIAIDFDNHAWVICRTGIVVKYEFNDNGDGDYTNDITELKRIDLNSGAGSGTSGGASYNYSDMTGLRTIPKKLIIGGSNFVISGTTFSGFEAELQSELSTCTCAGCTLSGSDCEVPLTIFSVMGGDYTLQNLRISYGKLVPITIGGLVPCGREDDNSSTRWDETKPCNLCHLVLMIQLIIDFLLKLSAVVALFAIVLGGLLYIFSSGNQSRMESAKSGIKYALLGFVIIFIAWAMVATVLAILGYIDPLNGEWYIVNCNVP